MNDNFNVILEWLRGGASLSSAGAVITLAALLRVVFVPLAAKIMERAGYKPDGNAKRLVVAALAYMLVWLINYFAVQHGQPTLDQSTLLTMSVTIAGLAVGIHQTTKLNLAALIAPEPDVPPAPAKQDAPNR